MGAQIKIGQDGRNMIFWNFTFSLVPLHIPATVISRSVKAMKSSPLLGLFCGSEFWGFSLLKILIGGVFLCFKLETIVSSALLKEGA